MPEVTSLDPLFYYSDVLKTHRFPFLPEEIFIIPGAEIKGRSFKVTEMINWLSEELLIDFLLLFLAQQASQETDMWMTLLGHFI